MNTDITLFQTIDLIIKSIFLGLGLWLSYKGYQWKTKIEKMEIVEKSLLDMQRFNEFVLSDEKNLKAAVLSTNPQQEFVQEDSRCFFVTLMRVNRICRIWLYHETGFINGEKRDELVNAHAPTIKAMTDVQFDSLMQRGYPKEFKKYLRDKMKSIEKAEEVKPINI